jgi:hypothetical protein
VAPKSIQPPYIPPKSISSLLGKWSVAAMEEHKGVVPAKKSKCMVPVMKSKVEAIAAGVSIYGGGGNDVAVVAVVAGIGVADSSLFDNNWCCTGAMNSTMAEVALPAPLPYMGGFLSLHRHLQIGGMQGAIAIQLLLNLGVCLLGNLHGNTLLLEAL